jgi:hypothetical protein
MTPERFDQIVSELRAALMPVPGEVPRPTPEPTTPPAQPPHVDGTVEGYDRVLRYLWDWSRGSLVAYTYESGGIGERGLVVISFTVPANAHGLGSISIAPYPGDVSGCEREISISTTEGDFSLPFPYTRKGYDTGAQFQIGGVSRFAPVLVPGTRYYINIRSFPLPGAKADFVLQCSVPV